MRDLTQVLVFSQDTELINTIEELAEENSWLRVSLETEIVDGNTDTLIGVEDVLKKNPEKFNYILIKHTDNIPGKRVGWSTIRVIHVPERMRHRTIVIHDRSLTQREVNAYKELQITIFCEENKNEILGRIVCLNILAQARK